MTYKEENSTRAVKFKRLDPDLEPPTRAHPGDGAIDLRTREDVTLSPGEYKTIPTGIAVAIPFGFGGFVLPRSGLAAKHGVSIVNAPGLVDAGYRGEIGVILINHGAQEVSFKRGDRIAQLSVIPVSLVPWAEVDDLDSSSRAEGGFGSSGVN